MSATEPFDYTFGLAERGPRRAVAWLGERIGVVIECPEDGDSSDNAVLARNALSIEEAARNRILRALDTLYETMESTTCSSGPSPYNESGVHGLAPVEIPLDNNGAYAWARDGVSGISVDMELFAPLCADAESLDDSVLAVNYVFFYEMSKNFWEPSFDDVFDWAMDGEEDNWGWWLAGFSNLWAIVLPEIVTPENAVEMDYFGEDRSVFRARMKSDIRACIRARHNFDTAWKTSRMPWNPEDTINSLMTGLLLALYDAYGGAKFLKSFFAELRVATPVNDDDDSAGSDKFQQCRDNFYRVTSRAAQLDLKHCFVEQLRWQLSNEALQEIDTLYPNNKPCAPLPVGEAMNS